MRKQLFFLLLSLAGLLCPARAQFIGYTSPQTVQSTVTGTTPIACTPGVAQSYLVPNLGQTEHAATIHFPATQPTVLSMEFDGVDNQANQFPISDAQQGIPLNATGELKATGYYPKVLVVVTCQPNTATYTVNYAGTSATPILFGGASQQTQLSKIIGQGVNAGGNLAVTFRSPFGNSSGYAIFTFIGSAGPGGSNLAIDCNDSVGLTIQTSSFALATPVGVQSFPISSMPCYSLTARYTNGGASATTFTLEYIFNPPGFPSASTSPIGSVTQGTVPWVVSGTVTSNPSLSSTILSGQQAVTNADVALATNTLTHGICVAALSTNGASIFIGTTGVTTSTGLELPAKASVCLSVSNSNAVHVIAAAGGSSVSWVGN